jgi:hypothetical protein
MVFWPSYHPQKIILQSHKEKRMETTAEYVEEKGYQSSHCFIRANAVAA